jgi:hypothetical protein
MNYCCKEFEVSASPHTVTLADGRKIETREPDLRMHKGQWTFFYNCCYGECDKKTHQLAVLKFCPYCGTALT